MALSEAQIARYARQILVPEVGGAGQGRLLSCTVDLIGHGPVVACAAAHLAAAGVGRLRLSEGPARPDELGLWLGPEDLGLPRVARLARAAEARNADARFLPVGEGRPDARLWAGEVPWAGESLVAVATSSGEGLLFRTDCETCARRWAAPGGMWEPALAYALGALAAGELVKRCLGLEAMPLGRAFALAAMASPGSLLIERCLELCASCGREGHP